MILVVFAALFLVVLFLTKNTSFLSALINKAQEMNSGGLTYSTTTIGELVNTDTDGDSIPDWEENLYGTDPTKKETTPGILDSEAIDKLKIAGTDGQEIAKNNYVDEQSLTKTDEFSRELFATIAATGQTMDQETVDKISSSLAKNIQNSGPRKIFVLADITIIKDDSVQAVKKYNDTMNSIQTKYPIKGSVIGILQKFLGDGTNVNASALKELDAIVKPSEDTINAILKVSVPQSLSALHLNFLNGLERVMENLNDIQLYETDPVVAMGAISNYENNTVSLQAAFISLNNAINKKLNN
jgi:hypothetical protein